MAELYSQGNLAERGKPSRRTRWYHQAFLVPLLALAFFCVASVSAPDKAEAGTLVWSSSDSCYYEYVQLSAYSYTYNKYGCYRYINGTWFWDDYWTYSPNQGKTFIWTSYGWRYYNTFFQSRVSDQTNLLISLAGRSGQWW